MKYHITDIPIKGKGMIALDTIKSDETICVCHTVPMSEYPEIWKFLFSNNGLHLALGDVSWVNHSFKPNAKIKWVKDAIHLIAVKDIQKKEEITHTYSNIEEYDISNWVDNG